jgi:hypothetical protein
MVVKLENHEWRKVEGDWTLYLVIDGVESKNLIRIADEFETEKFNVMENVVHNYYSDGWESGFNAGWVSAAKWANREDLISDIGSEAYNKEMWKYD